MGRMIFFNLQGLFNLSQLGGALAIYLSLYLGYMVFNSWAYCEIVFTFKMYFYTIVCIFFQPFIFFIPLLPLLFFFWICDAVLLHRLALIYLSFPTL